MHFLVTLLFKMVPKHSTEMLVSVSRNKKTVMCLMEKTWVLETFLSGMSYSSVDHEFNVNGSTIHSQ